MNLLVNLVIKDIISKMVLVYNQKLKIVLNLFQKIPVKNVKMALEKKFIKKITFVLQYLNLLTVKFKQKFIPLNVLNVIIIILLTKTISVKVFTKLFKIVKFILMVQLVKNVLMDFS